MLTETAEIPDIPDGAEASVIERNLPREVTSWKLAGLVASDGRAFLRCTFDQEVGGVPDAAHPGDFVGVEKRAFTVHWEMASLKEFVRHVVSAATEIERRVTGLVIDDLRGPSLAEVLPGGPVDDAFRAGYL